MIKTKSLLLLMYCSLFFLTTIFLHGQSQNNWDYSSQKITTKDGLPSLEVYFVHEDNEGYLWFGTDHGLVRYNGYEFKVFTEKDGLEDNTVFVLLEDSKGGFWLICKDQKLNYYDRKKFWKHNVTIRKKNQKIAHFDLYNDTLIASNHNRTKSYTFTLSEGLKERNWQSEDDSVRRNYITLNNNGHSFIYRMTIEDNRRTPIKSTFNDNLDIYYTHVVEIDSTHKLFIKKNYNQKDKSPKLLLVNQDSIVYEKYLLSSNQREKISTLFNNGNGNINISTNNGIFLFDVFKGKIIEHILPGEFITSSLRDKEGNLWVSSRDNGVWVIISNFIKTIKPNAVDGKNKFTRIRVFKDKLYASDISGQIYLLNEDYRLSKKIDETELQKLLLRESFDFEIDSPHSFYLGSELAYYNSKKNLFLNATGLKEQTGSIKVLQRISENRILIGTHRGVNILNTQSQKGIKKLKSKFSNNWCNALFEDKDKKLWVGTTNGLFNISKDSLIQVKMHHSNLLRKRVLAINQFLDGSILVGSKGEGLVVVQGNDVFSITEKDGLIGNMVQSLYVHSDSSIWVGTNKGVSKIETSGSLSQRGFVITNFNTKKGLPSNMVNDIKAYDGKIWFATSNGLSYIKEEEYKTNITPLKVYLKDLMVGSSSVSLTKDNLELEYNENDIRFNYLAICTRCRQNINYKFRLKGFKNEWSFTSNRNVQYTSLDAGTYTFQLFAANEDNIWNEYPIEKTFTIKPHFSKTTWFKAVMVLLFLVLLSILFYTFFRRQQRRAQLNLKLVKLEQQALRASMNPHFVFNALNSIQDFINKNDMVEANEYLVKFSHLIRTNLEITKTNEVFLKDELERLELYLSIEKLRFQEKLSYNISVENTLESSKLLVPVMILQPFVENAIIHGILPKNDGGHVQISCSKVNRSQYRVTITDDGIGINAKRSQKRNTHKSLSTDFTKTRLDLLSQSTLKPYGFSITNLADVSNKSGTVVEFILPI